MKIKYIIYPVIIIFIFFIIYFFNSIYKTDEIYYDVYEKIDEMLISASEKYRYLVRGGKNSEFIQLVKNDKTQGVLIIKDENINSEKKLKNFLKEVYTDNMTNEIYEKLDYFTEEGFLYKPAVDGTYSTAWESAEIQDIKINKISKEITVTLKVKIVDCFGEEFDYELKTIKIKYTSFNGKYNYKLNTPIH